MLSISLRFPSGRFHATPWGRHVNEGTPEWPPSPWRLLRALIAVWKKTLPDDISDATMRGLLELLCEPPEFRLPKASTGHTRHYMPQFKDQVRDKVFDAFVAIEKTGDESDVVFHWSDIQLDVEQREVLTQLLTNLNYFGRAESWCQARLLDDEDATKIKPNCVLLEKTPDRGAVNPIRVLCVDPATAFENEHTPKTKPKKKSETPQPIYDPDWHLAFETLHLHKDKWSDPPGALWATYGLRSDCFAVAPRRTPSRSSEKRPTVARFALDGPVLPLIQKTLPTAEKMRFTLMGIFGRIEYERTPGNKYSEKPKDEKAPASPIFAGKDADGTPLKGHHHAFYLPTDEDGDGRIDHITLYARDGFGPKELQALDRLRRLKLSDGDPLGVLLLGLGTPSQFNNAPLFHPVRTFISATPYLSPLHPKKKDWKDIQAFMERLLEQDLNRYFLERLNCESPDFTIEAIADSRIPIGQDGARSLRPIQFKRFRQKRSDDGGRRPTGAFEVTFKEPVQGPLVLGHSCHFGMGLFLPKRSRADEENC